MVKGLTVERKKPWGGCKRSACWLEGGEVTGQGLSHVSIYICYVSKYVYKIYIYPMYTLRSLREQLTRVPLSPESIQNKLPQNMPLRHVDYFELNTIKAQETQEELSTSPLTTEKNLDNRERKNAITRDNFSSE